MAGERIADTCAAGTVALQDGGTLRLGHESMQQYEAYARVQYHARAPLLSRRIRLSCTPRAQMKKEARGGWEAAAVYAAGAMEVLGVCVGGGGIHVVVVLGRRVGKRDARNACRGRGGGGGGGGNQWEMMGEVMKGGGTCFP